MNGIFRRIRQKLLSENNIKKYLPYALGEILLVVIGILLALQINNWNESRQLRKKVATYRANLIIELEGDIAAIRRINADYDEHADKILNYVQAYDTSDSSMELVAEKMADIDYVLEKFTTGTYSIEEIISTGSLSLLEGDEKNALLELKATYVEIGDYYTQNTEDLSNYTKSVNDEIDVLNFYGYTASEHPEVEGWKLDRNSRQFRLYNNELAAVLYFYTTQKNNHEILKRSIDKLLEIIKHKD